MKFEVFIAGFTTGLFIVFGAICFALRHLPICTVDTRRMTWLLPSLKSNQCFLVRQ